jgi:hypothetical protein
MHNKVNLFLTNGNTVNLLKVALKKVVKSHRVNFSFVRGHAFNGNRSYLKMQKICWIIREITPSELILGGFYPFETSVLLPSLF